MSRPTVDEWAMGIALAVATRGTCAKRQVGCVLLDRRRWILAAGYNGPAAGVDNCTEYPCPGAGSISGSGLCAAVHAEQNAMLQCRDIQLIDACYVTLEPCPSCAKLLLNTGCRRVVFAEAYESGPGLYVWRQGGRLGRLGWSILGAS